MTDPDKVRDLFDEASDLPPEDQAAFLARECHGQPELLAQVQALLAAEARADAGGFLHQPALHLMARQTCVDLPRDNHAGQMFARYRAIRLLGTGGMGEVYLAEDTELTRKVALKIIKTALGANRLFEQFERERRILAHLNHDNIAGLLDAGTSVSGAPFLVMEYVDGCAITEYCDTAGLDIPQRLALFRVVCSAVQYAHQNVVVHRDLKPGNILVAREGQVKLLDFGIAKLLDSPATAQAGATLLPALTPDYASPEQAKGELTSTATDVYSLGAVLYELLTGSGLYQVKRRTTAAMLKAICEEEPRMPSAATFSPRISEIAGGAEKLRRHLRGDLEHIVLKALRKEPQARYSSVEQFSADIGRYLEGVPVTARRGTLSYRAAKFVRRNRMAVIAVGAVSLTLLAGLTAISWEARVAIARGRVAQKRFEQTRKLAHAVLFDYHDSIASLPGSTLVREKMVTDALGYLNALSQDAAGDTGLQLELADAYLRVGDVQGKPYTANLGQTDAALESYRKAQAILQAIVRQDPRNPSTQRQLGNAYERIGSIQLRKFQWGESEASQQRGLQIREKLLRQTPRDPGILNEVGLSRLYLGDALQARCFSGNAVMDCLRQALESQRMALETFQDVSRQNPGNFDLRRNMAEAYMKIGFRLRDLASYSHDQSLMPQALDSEQKAMRIRQEVAGANPSNSRDRRNLADQRMLLADAQTTVGDLPSALAGYRRSVAEFQSLYRADPVNAEGRRDLSFARFKLAQALVKTGAIPAAFREYEQAMLWAKQLLAEDPNNGENRQQVAGLYLRESEAAELIRDFPRAARLYDSYLQYAGDDISNSYRAGELNMQAARAANVKDEDRRGFWLAACDRMRHCLEILRARGGSTPPAAADRDFWNRTSRELAAAEAALAALAAKE